MTTAQDWNPWPSRGWCLTVGVVTALNVAVVRVVHQREKNAEMPRTTTLLLALLLVAMYATLARAVATG